MSLPIACEILRVECTKPFFVVISYPKGHICKETNVCSVTSNDNDTASMFISVSVPNP